MRKFFREFKTFISRGNVFDMAVGMIIATAFNKIVSSMVNDIIMPLVTYATGATSLKALSVPLRWAEDGTVTLAWNYGNFIQYIIDFLIIALSVFIMVKIVTKSRKKFQEFGDDFGDMVEEKQEKKKIKKLAKKEHRPFEEMWTEYKLNKEQEEKLKKEQEEQERRKKEEEQRKTHPTQEQLLQDIKMLLEKQNKQD